MIYSIAYNIKEAPTEGSFVNALKSIGEMVLFMPNCYFLSSDESRNSIYTKLFSTLGPNDLLYVVETPIDTMSGWLPTNAVKWLDQHRKG